MGCSNSTSHQTNDTEILEKLKNHPGVIFDEKISIINDNNRNILSWLPTDTSNDIDVLTNNIIKGVIIFSHGLNEHSLCHSELAIIFVELGYIVYSIDHYSHGKSDGRKGIILDYNVLVEDFVAFGKSIKLKHPNLPMFIFSHSMGTLIATLAINKIKDIQGVVFSAPPFYSGPAVSSPLGIKLLYPLTQTSYAIRMSSVMAALNPSGYAAPLIINELTSDLNQIEIIKKDPRMGPDYVTNKSAYEIFKLIKESKDELKNISIPFLIIHGESDQISLLKGSQYLYDNTSTIESDRSFIIISNGKHELFHEVDIIKKQAIDAVTTFYEHQYKSLNNISDTQV